MPEDSLYYRYGPPKGRWKPRAAPVPQKQPRDGRPCFYAMLLPKAIQAALQCGYALGVHGSMVTDLDLIAAPWTEDATPHEELAETIAKAIRGSILRQGAKFVEGKWIKAEFPGRKPHGRKVWTIIYASGIYVDLSVMPRRATGVKVARRSVRRDKRIAKKLPRASRHR